MKLVVDQFIPGIDNLFANQFEVIKLAADQITAKNLQLYKADILICRSVTKVNHALLQDTDIKLVATATSGIDHVDVQYLQQHNIHLCAAAGSNAPAVTDYIFSVLAILSRDNLLCGKRAGIIGVGHIGSKVQQLLELLGFEVVVNDPPRAEHEKDFHSTMLDDFKDLDLISVNAAYHEQPPHANFYLLDKTFFQRLKPGCVIINTARGAIINTQDLITHGKHLTWCLDVFEDEPHIQQELVQKCLIATPHIAGYSIESKVRASWVVYDKIRQIYNLPVATAALDYMESMTLQLPAQQTHVLNGLANWYDVILQLYDPLIETRILQQQATDKLTECFSKLRVLHNQRHEFANVSLNLLREYKKIIL